MSVQPDDGRQTLTPGRFQLQRLELAHQRVGEDEAAHGERARSARFLGLREDRHLQGPGIETVQHEADVQGVDDLARAVVR